ncbi:alkaline phosphatase family protein [Methylovirgula sp. 4M-Z18]|uniref:alkaline phosphatase family protein n=1 Tax=Methylovirgula sp. 4M-Z18 TaxID=2293567 RepID=UPI000E2F8356|nr:alkaline phosphatase family protein [Methylovirgula sp. 4M-Z18]RFB79256.1 phosphoesterase [Methylovirgula sp. 4M-Z18]
MPDIAHVVVLMLENRSFDCMLGRLYPSRVDFNGLKGIEKNCSNGVDYPVWTSGPALDPQNASIPHVDPGERFTDMNDQIFGAGNVPPAPATMAGFVENYLAQNATNDPEAVMHGFSPEQVPVLSTLAKSFGVSDSWHASAPNQTWPNRFFMHTGTAAGYVNNSPTHFPYVMPTIFNRLSENQRSWKIYHHDIPQAATLSAIWAELPDKLASFESDFMTDAMAGRLPNYSFIEPRYFADPALNRMPNDQHPPHNVSYGERLIARCYDALRHGAGWKQTLFIITYDEHGGIYDHVPPPIAMSPDNLRSDGFAFDRYGVRVPAVLISPWIPAGSIVRPPASSPYPFDHTSVLATLRKLFQLGAPLSQRDAVAPDLLDALSLPAPTNDGPDSIPVPMVSSSADEIAAALNAPANDFQKALAKLADNLPDGLAFVKTQIDALATSPGTGAAPDTVAEALKVVMNGLERFLG